jgi:hypothetical protein
MLANKRHQLLRCYQESDCINKAEQPQNDEAREPIRISGREKFLEKTLIVHCCTLVPEANSICNSDISREHANAFGVGNPHSVLENCQGEIRTPDNPESFRGCSTVVTREWQAADSSLPSVFVRFCALH